MTISTIVGGLVGARRCAGCSALDAVLCAVCARDLGPAPPGPSPLGVDRTIAAWPYEGAARELVLGLKLAGARAAAGPLAGAMGAVAARTGGLRGTVTWVPGKPAATRTRGFDHAELLGRSVASRLGLPCRSLLERLRIPLDQSSLTASQRRANLTGAFSARAAPAEVVLVDDLLTTGATAEACARALRGAGAVRVELLVACRA